MMWFISGYLLLIFRLKHYIALLFIESNTHFNMSHIKTQKKSLSYNIQNPLINILTVSFSLLKR